MKKVAFVLLPLLLLAQNYVLQKDVLSAGGSKSTSTDYILQGTLGQTTIGNVEDTDYKAVIGFWHPPEPFPPDAPYIAECEKSGNSMTITWNMITTDTLGNPDVVHYYCVYRNTSPDFVPGTSDSITAVMQPDTTFTDAGVLDSTASYYYLVKAVDVVRNRSSKSNMGYKLNKFMNENAAATDRNWTALPYDNDYATVSELVADLSPAGNPLTVITRLDTAAQQYESYLWLGFMWAGTDFAITPGTAYEMVSTADTFLVLVGSNDPDGLINLNQNAAKTSRNWVSIPYNSIYNTVSDITTDFAPAGNPVTVITRLDDTLQQYESYLWLGFMWAGPDFAIVPGTGYEFVVTTDTFWNPTEHTNTAKCMLLASNPYNTAVEMQLGRNSDTDRMPSWQMADGEGRLTQNASRYTLCTAPSVAREACSVTRNASSVEHRAISHTVCAYFNVEEYTDFAFTAYRLNRPFDVLTEQVIGSGVARKGNHGALWFDVGNFKTPWHDGEEVVLIFEAIKDGKGYCTVAGFTLDGTVDIQTLGDITLQPIPEPETGLLSSAVSWKGIDNQNIIGYSVYRNDIRLNDVVITESAFAASGDVSLRPVIRGGFETVYGSQGPQSMPDGSLPIAYSCAVQPNPFATRTSINYAIPNAADVSIRVYDVSGRHVKTLVSKKCEPGYYTQHWSGQDDHGRNIAAGVYFLEMQSDEYEAHHKVVLVR